jgi:hypothetical protein
MRNPLPSNYKILIHHKMLRKTPETIKRFGCVTLVTILVLEKNYCFACTDMGLHLSVGVAGRASQPSPGPRKRREMHQILIPRNIMS